MVNNPLAEKQTVFVTGASSALLQEVIKQIATTEFEVVGLTRSAPNSKSEGIRWVEADLFEPDKYSQELNKADVVIHAAALTHSTDSSEYQRVNFEGTKVLLKQLRSNRAQLVVLISSRVAGNDSGSYGLSKLLAENEVKSSTTNWLIIRPAEVFGGSKREGIDSTIISALSKRIQPCPVGLRSKLFPIHRSDAAKAIYKAIFEGQSTNRTVYINGPQGYTYYELLKQIRIVTGKPLTILPVPYPVLAIIATVSALTGINFGFVPDQVKRLYSEKEIGQATETTISLEEYIAQTAKTTSLRT